MVERIFFLALTFVLFAQMSYHTTVQAISHHQDVSAIQRSFDSKAKPPPATKALKLLYPGTTIHAWHDGLRTFYNPSRKEFKYSDPKHARYPGRLYYHSKGMRLASIKMIRDAIKGVKGGNNISLNDVVRAAALPDCFRALNASLQATALVTRAARRAAEKRAKRDGHRIKDRRFALLIPISIRPKGNWELEKCVAASARASEGELTERSAAATRPARSPGSTFARKRSAGSNRRCSRPTRR